MSEQSDIETLREVYERLDYQLVEVNDLVTVSTSSPARFKYGKSPCVTDALEIKRFFEHSNYSCIDVLAHNGSKWYEFSYTAQVFEPNSNEFVNLSVTTAGVTILKRQNPVSFESFKRLVRHVEDALDATLVPMEKTQ